MTPEQEQQFYDNLEKEVDKLTVTLDLEDWQVFYADSILTHNYLAMMDDLNNLNRAKVSNVDAFQRAQDKWMEASYNAFRGILSDEQWEKYLKGGAARDKKARDKREAKRNK